MNRDAQRRRRLLLASGSALLLGGGLGFAARAQDVFSDAALRGAGSTFVAPLMEAWMRQYRLDPNDLLGHQRAPNSALDDALSNDGIDYEPVGSLAGIQRMRAGSVDFAASEMPLSQAELQRGGLQQFPWVAGGVAIVATGLGEAPLRLDGPTLAAIYLGRVQRWSDPALATLNPGRTLPDEPIQVLHRDDGSGTTFTFAAYLARHDPQWAQQVGVDLSLAWPTGRGARGSSGIVSALRDTPLAIGYVNAVQARQAGLAIASLRNLAGQDVLPDRAGVEAALAATPEAGGSAAGASGHGPAAADTAASAAAPATVQAAAAGLPIDAPGAASYPLVATVFGLAPATSRGGRQRRAAAFLAWTLERGGPLAERLGYSSLPAERTRAALERLGGA